MKQKRVKVKKKAVPKPPWYERPKILMLVIAGLLLAAGLLMGWIYRPQPTVSLGESPADTTAAALPPPQPDTTSVAPLPPGVLTAEEEIPQASLQGFTTPILVETLAEAAAVRARLREARKLVPLTEASRRGRQMAGAFGFFALEAAVGRSKSASGKDSTFWAPLHPVPEHRPKWDLELHVDAEGRRFVCGFVGRAVAAEIARLGRDLPLPPPPEDTHSRGFAFWKRHESKAPEHLYEGAVVSLYADLHPDAQYFVSMPLDRLRPVGSRVVPLDQRRRMAVLQVQLLPKPQTPGKAGDH